MAENHQPGPDGAASVLGNRIRALDAVYRKFGRAGLNDYPLSDITLLLASKRLDLRDAPKGRDAGEQRMAANRLLELEIRDLSGHVDSLLSGAGLSVLQRTDSRAESRAGRRDQRNDPLRAKPGRHLDRGG